MNKPAKFVWLGLFLQAAGWQFLLPIFVPPRIVPGLLLLGGAAAVLGFSLRDTVRRQSRGALACYGIAGFVSLLLLPWPESLLASFILGGALLCWLGRGHLVWPGTGLLVTGVIGLCQAALLPVLMDVGARFHELPWLAPVLEQAFEFFGHKTTFENNSVFLQGAFQVHEFALNAEHFGWTFAANAACGLLICQLLCRARRKAGTFAAFIAAALVYALARYLLLALLYLDLPAFQLFWHPWILCLSYLPLFALVSLSRWFAAGFEPSQGAVLEEAAATPAPGSSGRKTAFAGLMAFIGAACFIMAWGWEDPGRAKPGRIIIDEAHSRWERIDRAYDTEWYGEESGYNYYCLARFLEAHYRVQRTASAITPALLADCDILVIKTPTSAFTPEEIDAIETFVKRGGGLLLIGDHTNVFGTSTYLNPIASRFGLHFNIDATYDLPTGGLTLYKPPRRLPHPIVQWLPPFLFGTSCTLDVAASAQIPIVGYALRVAGHDYSTPSFFTTKTDGPHIGFGVFPQLGAVKAMRGRVVAFTDSTVFSNFWMFLPGKPELLLGCTAWLNRTNAHAALPWWLGLLGAWFALAALRFSANRSALRFPLFIATFSAGVFLAALFVAALNRRNYPLPAPHTPYRTICFDRQYSDFDLPSETLLLEPTRDFHTFYVWVQRVGYVPRVSSKLSNAVDGNKGIVLLNPSRPLIGQDIECVTNFVEKGGVLFVFASPEDMHASANSILAPFNVRIETVRLGRQNILNAAGEIVAINQDTATTDGGQGILFTAEHRPVLALKRQGRGAIIFGGNARLFCAATLGTVNQVPDPNQKRLYQTIFRLFREIEAPHPP